MAPKGENNGSFQVLYRRMGKVTLKAKAQMFLQGAVHSIMTDLNLEIFVTLSLDLIVVVLRKMQKFGHFCSVWVSLS